MAAKEIHPVLADGTRVEINMRVLPITKGHADKTGTIVDHEVGPGADAVEVRWDHTDTESYWPADRLMLARP